MSLPAPSAHVRLSTIARRLRRLFLRFVAITAQVRIHKARREAEFRRQHDRR